MNTLFRILVILVAATLIGGLMYVGVSASNTSAGPGDFEQGEGRPRPAEGVEFGDGDEGEFRPEREGRGEGGFGLPGGVLKALVLMSIAGGIYSLIAGGGKQARKISSSPQG